MKKLNLNNLVEVPENIVIAAASFIPEDEESGLRTVLKAAEEYRAANMTPMFVLDRVNMDILCAARETFGKKLN